MPDKYRLQWTDQGVSHRVDIYPPGTTAVTEDVVTSIPFSAVRSLKTVTSYGSRIPYGMASPVRTTMVIDCRQIPTDLVAWLTTTKVEVTAQFKVANSDSDVIGKQSARVGAVMDWWVMLDGQIAYKRIWMGVAQVLGRPDFDGPALTVEFEDLAQVAAKAIPIASLRDATARAIQLNQDIVTMSRSQVFDWVWSAETSYTNPLNQANDTLTKWFFVAHLASMSAEYESLDFYWAVPTGWVFEVWSTCFARMVNAIARISPASSLRDAQIHTALYHAIDGQRKHTYQADPVPGDLLTTAELYSIAVCARKHAGDVGTSEEYDDWVSYTMLDDLVANERTLYDLLLEIPSSRFKVWGLQYQSGSGELITRMIGDLPFAAGKASNMALTYELQNPKLTIRGETPFQITAENEFRLGENDAESATAKHPAGWSDEVLPVPATFGCDAVAHKRFRNVSTRNQDKGAQDLANIRDFRSAGLLDYSVTDGSSLGDQWPGMPPRLLGLYYIDAPYNASASPPQAMLNDDGAIIRCHERQRFLADGSPDVPPVTMPYELPSTQYAIGGAAIAVQQQESGFGLLRQLSTAIFANYYRDGSALIECGLPATIGQTMWDGHPLMPAINMYARVFEVDVSEEAPWLADVTLPSLWRLTSAETEWTTGIMTAKLWGKP